MHLVQLYVLFLVQTHFCWGQYTMVTPSQVVMAPESSDVTLPCQVEPAADLREQVVEWARLDLTPPYVHIRRDGLDLLMNQNPLYLGRTALSESRLQKGDLSLSLSQVKLSDGGTYRCFLPRTHTEAQVTLRVEEKVESSPSCSLAWTLFALSLSAAAAAAALVVWKFRANKQVKDFELGEREEKESMLKREETIEDELKFLDKVIHKLNETKIFLMKVKEQPQAALYHVINVLEAEKNRPDSKFVIMDKKMKKLNIDKLEGEKKVYEKTIADFEEQIVRTEEMIMMSLKKRSVMEAERMNVTKFTEKEKKQQETESPEKMKEKSAEQENNEGETQDQNEAEIKPEGIGENMNELCDEEVISFHEETFGRT